MLRVCLVFLQKFLVGEDLSFYVLICGEGIVLLEIDGVQVCVDGVLYGGCYQIIVCSGLLVVDGEKLEKLVDFFVYVCDWLLLVYFIGCFYVLLVGGDLMILFVFVNIIEVEVSIYWIGDCVFVDIFRDNWFLCQFGSYQVEQIEYDFGEKVWIGLVEMENLFNQDVIMVIFFFEIGLDLKFGVYVMMVCFKLDV